MTHDEMKQLAHLARIGISDQEIESFSKDFDSILGYVDQLNQVDVSSVESRYAETNIARPDQDAYPAGRSVGAMLADAPDSEAGFYKVPKIL